jgi:hypothetical protein
MRSKLDLAFSFKGLPELNIEFYAVFCVSLCRILQADTDGLFCKSVGFTRTDVTMHLYQGAAQVTGETQLSCQVNAQKGVQEFIHNVRVSTKNCSRTCNLHLSS